MQKQVILQRIQLQTNHPVEISATNRSSSCRQFSYRYKSPCSRRSHLVERSARNKSPCRDQLQRNHPVESSATNKSPREFSYEQITLQRVQLYKSPCREISQIASHLVESSATKKPSCREFSYKQIILHRVQLQINYPVESSATNKFTLQRDQLDKSHPTVEIQVRLPYRQISQKQVTLQRVQLQTSHPCREFSRQRNSSCREFFYKQIALQRVQMQTNHPVESAATNKSTCREFSYISSPLVERSAANKLSSRE